jgi:acetamidase/formamidase
VTRHHLDATRETTNDVYSRDHAPVLTVESGDSVVVESLDASGHLERQTVPGEQRPRLFTEARGHALTGPIAVRGARPGQTLAVRFDSLRPGEWGWTVAGGRATPITTRLGLDAVPPSWLLWEIDADAGSAVESRGPRVALAPFLGVTGVAPAEPGEHTTTPPRASAGGNIDCRELVAGSTLYLPVRVPGALVYLGDGHAAQGDGEVGGTAVECPMTTEVRLELVDDRPVDTIHAETPAGRITFGFDADLDVATGDALDAMVSWLALLLDVDRATALAFASAVVDLRVTQVANQTWGVHAVLPTGALGV